MLMRLVQWQTVVAATQSIRKHARLYTQVECRMASDLAEHFASRAFVLAFVLALDASRMNQEQERRRPVFRCERETLEPSVDNRSIFL